VFKKKQGELHIMSKVTSKQKGLIRDYWIEGFTLSEIAKKLQIKRSTVYYYAKQYTIERQQRREEGLKDIKVKKQPAQTINIQDVTRLLKAINKLPPDIVNWIKFEKEDEANG